MTFSSNVRITVGNKDILCGRGKRCFSHLGNQSFRVSIAQNLDACVDATRMNKTLIIRRLAFHYINQNGSRFLKKHKEGEWYDMGMCEAKDKIAHSFRDAAAGDKVKYIALLRKTLKKEEFGAPLLNGKIIPADDEGFIVPPANLDDSNSQQLANIFTPIKSLRAPEPLALQHIPCEPLLNHVLRDLLTMDVEDIPTPDSCSDMPFPDLLAYLSADHEDSWNDPSTSLKSIVKL